VAAGVEVEIQELVVALVVVGMDKHIILLRQLLELPIQAAVAVVDQQTLLLMGQMVVAA